MKSGWHEKSDDGDDASIGGRGVGCDQHWDLEVMVYKTNQNKRKKKHLIPIWFKEECTE